MAGKDETDLRRITQRVVYCEILRARNAEHMIDAFAQQCIDQRPRAGGFISH